MSDCSRLKLTDPIRSTDYCSSHQINLKPSSRLDANGGEPRKSTKHDQIKISVPKRHKLSSEDNQNHKLGEDESFHCCESSWTSQSRHYAKCIIDIYTPVSVCIWLVIATIKATDCNYYSSQSVVWYAQLMFEDQTVDKKTKLWQSLSVDISILMGIVIIAYLIMLLYKYNCYMIIDVVQILISLLSLFTWMPDNILKFLNVHNIPLDLLTFNLIVWNIGVPGILCIHWKGPLSLQQSYIVVNSATIALQINAIMLFIEDLYGLRDWPVWILLFIVSIWDIFAVLYREGPLRKIVETARERNEQLFPALMYSTTMIWESVSSTPPVSTLNTVDNTYKRPLNRIRTTSYPDERSPTASISLPNTPMKNYNYRFRNDLKASTPNKRSDNFPHEIKYDDGARTPEIKIIQSIRRSLGDSDEIFDRVKSKQYESKNNNRTHIKQSPTIRDLGLTSIPRSTFSICEGSETENGYHQELHGDEGGVKLGLGDFIFFSVLMGKISTYNDCTITISCFVSLLAGLCLKLSLLKIFRRLALPALPIPIAFGMVTFFAGRQFVVPLADNLSMNGIFV